MTIKLSSHVLSFNKKLFLSVISLFIAFAICFMAFQYRREKEYKIELLNTQLQNYNDRLNDFLRGRDTLNIQQLNDYVCEHTFEDLRVTLINKNGTVIYDNLEKDPSHFENHHNRQEIKKPSFMAAATPLTDNRKAWAVNFSIRQSIILIWTISFVQPFPIMSV